MDSHRDNLTHAVQDAYSMRCAPQVAGAARDTLDFATGIATRELASIVDNPVVLPDGRVRDIGQLHGRQRQPEDERSQPREPEDDDRPVGCRQPTQLLVEKAVPWTTVPGVQQVLRVRA